VDATAQGMIALGAYAAVVRITAIGAAAGIAASCLLIVPLSLDAIPPGELVSDAYRHSALRGIAVRTRCHVMHRGSLSVPRGHPACHPNDMPARYQ